MRHVSMVALCCALGACTTVQVHYKAVGGFDVFDDAAKQAKEGMAFYALPRIHVSVAPVDDAAAVKKTDKPAVTSTDAQTSGGPKDSDAAASEKKDAQKNDVQKKDLKTTDKAANKDQPGHDAGQAGQGASQHAANQTTSAAGAAGAQTGAEPSHEDQPAKLIDDKMWAATLTTKADVGHGFMMGGTQGFWRKTSVTGTRAANSDQITSVTVKAENLTATRLGQVATVLGYVISPSKGGTKEAGEASADTLKPFDFDVTLDMTGQPKVVEGTNWTYTLTFENVQPDGAVKFDTFMSHTKDAVNFFPVPACLNADLVLSLSGQKKAVFPLVVAVGDLVRLEPLPIDGKLSLSKICSSTVEGATTSNNWDDVFSNLAALQGAYKQLTTPPAQSASGTKSTDAGKPTDGAIKPKTGA